MYVREAGIESLEHGRTRYTSNAGLKELRAEVAKYLERRMGLHYDPLHEVLITVGGSEAIDMCIRTLVQPGDEVIIPEPCFVCYEPITTLSGGVPVHVACRQEDEFRLRADALKAAITPKTKLLIMPFPNNPTGAVMEREDLEAVAEVLRGTNIMVLSDEIYAELNYGLRPHVSIATLPGMAERTIVVNGFSKTYAMTGWRLGYACGPAPIIRIMTKIHQSAIMSAPTTSQYAAITALKECDGEIDRMRDEYNMRRRLVVRSFNDMGLTCFEPRGAFYAFPCIKSTGMTSQEFCTKLLEQKHVAIIPGDAFGASGEGYCRVSYAYSVEHLTEALKRIREFLKENDIDYKLYGCEVDGRKAIYCHFENKDADFFKIASTGTRSLALFYYWYIRMEKASFVFIDEFDAFYHFELAESVQRHLKKMSGVQIFTTTHNTDLMSNDLLRPDSYFLLENNRIKAISELTEKELRQAHNLQKMYKAGAFSGR